MTTTTTTRTKQVQGERPQRPWRLMTMQSTAFLNDQVEEIHRRLHDDPLYRSLISATTNAQAVEGSLATDDIMAATMIRDMAKSIGSDIGQQQLATIVKALRVVLRRYGASRRERGEIVEKE